jgi:molybdopterin-guanine dinucleotide biosynthesis protein
MNKLEITIRGSYKTGKTSVAQAIALVLRHHGFAVHVADLDHLPEASIVDQILRVVGSDTEVHISIETTQ